MWLATIEASRVAPDARAKLELYQCECRDVLARHFFGTASGPGAEHTVEFSADAVCQLITQIMQPMVEVLKTQGAQIATIAHQLSELAQRPGSFIAPFEAKSLSGRVSRAAALKAELFGGKKRSYQQEIRMSVLGQAGHCGTNCTYANLTPAIYSRVLRALYGVERSLADEQKRRAAPVAQLTLLSSRKATP